MTFLVTDSAGTPLGPQKGEYVTDKNGRIVLNSLTPGTTITAKEVKTVDGFVLDGTPQSILIKEGEGQQLTFYNKRVGGVWIYKVNEDDRSIRIPDTTFEIHRVDGGLVDTKTTDLSGRIHLDLDAGDYYALETKAAEGYQLSTTPTYFTVKDNESTEVWITNKAFSGIVIHKIDSVTGEGICGVKFLLYDSGRNPIGEYTTDDEGYIYIDDATVTGKGRLYVRELEAAPGYELDKEYKTVYVKPGELNWSLYDSTGKYYGLCMWSLYYGPRVRGANLDGQLNYLTGNIQQNMRQFGGDFDHFMRLEDPGVAAQYFCSYYERGAGASVRAQNAYKALTWINGG